MSIICISSFRLFRLNVVRQPDGGTSPSYDICDIGRVLFLPRERPY